MSYFNRDYLNELMNSEEIQKKIYRLNFELQSMMHTWAKIRDSWDEGKIAVAYVLQQIAKYANPFSITYDDVVSGKLGLREDVLCCFKEHTTPEMWGTMNKLLLQYGADDFAMVALLPVTDVGFSREITTPDSITKLAQHILDCHSCEDIADIGCGGGTFLLSTAERVPDAKYVGFEINRSGYMIASIRSELLGYNIDFRLQDAFSVIYNNDERLRFDKIFANYPFGLKLRNLGNGVQYLEQLSKDFPGLSKATSSDWVFNALICELLKENGKAIGIMTNGSTWNSIDTPMRKFFVEKRMVECVISLPARMFTSTNIATSMIVLSHGNEAVRLVDASKICQQGRRQNEFSDNDIDLICTAMKENSEIGKTISVEELRENEYSLSLSRYLTDHIQMENGKPFESIMKSITRGAPCTAKQLDEMVSNEITNMQYLMLANIKNGIIDEKLPYLSYIDSKYEKYCLKDKTLILSKNGYPYKVAVASVQEGQKILANGNLYIIEVDEKLADPYYLKAFFESEQGIAVLKSITVGATIPNIGVDKLKKIIIPLPSMDEQQRVAQKYQATLDEIAVLKLRLEKAISKLRHVFDEERDN